jgi:uncharacterized protein YjiS (DUF1127 family)
LLPSPGKRNCGSSTDGSLQIPRHNSERRLVFCRKGEFAMDGHFHPADQPLVQAPEFSCTVKRRRPVLVRMGDFVMGAVARMRSRRVLSLMDDRMLRDIGLDRGAAQYEISRSFPSPLACPPKL